MHLLKLLKNYIKKGVVIVMKKNEEKNIIEKQQEVIEILVRFVAQSKNPKTGNISQTYTSDITCPVRCPFRKKINGKETCYCKGGYCGIHWRAVSKYGKTPDKLKEVIEESAHTAVIRHNIGGDMATPGTSDIDVRLLNDLIAAFKNVKAYTYTHCEASERNFELAKKAEKEANFIINFSTEKIEDAKKVMEHGLNAVIAVNTMENDVAVVDGIKIVKCPNSAGKLDKNGDKMQCKMCGICWRKNRDFVVAFPAHGTKANVKKIQKNGFLMDI